MKHSGCKNSGGQGTKETRHNPSMETGESQELEGGYSRSKKETKRKSTLPHGWTCVTSKRGVGTQITEVWRQSRAPWHCKRRLWSSCSFYWTGLVCARKSTAAKVMCVIARLPDCDGQAADAIPAYTQVKMEDAPSLLRTPKSECPDLWIRLPRHKWSNMVKHWRSSGSSWTKTVRSPTRRPCCGKDILRTFWWD